MADNRPTRALVIPFHRYTPYYKDNYRILFDYWKKLFHLWHTEIDHLYLINANNYLYENEDKALIEEFVPTHISIICTNNFSHAENLNFVMPMIKEDRILLMDMDTFVYQKFVLDMYFNMMELPGNFDVVAMLERPSINKLSRFAPYFCMIKNEAMHKIEPLNFDPEPPQHLDPLAKFTHRLIEKGVEYTDAPDDRSTIQLKADGTILRNPQTSNCTGFYHVRNFNGGIHVIDSYNCDKPSFERDIQLIPTEELTREFGWVWTINKLTQKREKIENDIIDILKIKGVGLDTWYKFIEEFEKYHGYLKI